MRSYNFSMERLLELRVNKERTVMERFATLQVELQQQKIILSNLLKEYQLAKEKSLNYNNINELIQNDLYIKYIEERISKQKKVIDKSSEELEEARLELIKAQKDKKIMENLKEREFIVYQNNIKSNEQRELDEIAVLKYQKSVLA